MDADTFADWVEQARVKGGALEFTPPQEQKPAIGQVTIRGITETAAQRVPAGEPAEWLARGLAATRTDQVAQWEGLEALCCLDIDYHDTKAPDRNWLSAIVQTRLSPRPAAWHFSRSGGLHLFYLATTNHAADELAACAALRFRSLDASAGLELKRIVRGPGTEATHVAPAGQDSTGTFLGWMDSADSSDADRDAWLESEGMECGQRYEHERCPIEPGPNSKADKPVTVSEAGIYCFRCNGKGLTLGSRRPGFVPWSSLLGSPSSGELGVMVRRLTHWGHARYVFRERYDLPLALARLAYKAALNAYHADRPTAALVSSVFDERTEQLARVNNLWMTVDSSFVYPANIQPLIACLPACQFVNADGEPKVDLALVTEMLQLKDLARYGYKNVEVVHGYKMTQQFLADSPVTRVAVTNPPLAEHSNRCLPRYRRPTDRMSQEGAWATLETVVPRIDRTLIKTLLVSFGCSQETKRGLLPILFVSGPSAAGKSAMCQIACGIMGAKVGAEATYDADPSRFRAQIMTGAEKGPVVVFNELLKDSARGRHKATTREALDFVLNLTEDSTSHKLFTGSVAMGRLPTIVITEPVCPMNLQDETQLARRIRHHEVNGRKDEWRQTIAAAGISKLALIRTVSDAVSRACDAILSDVIDTYFSVPSNWDDLADSLGVKTIETSDAFEEQTPWLRELFRLVCVAPALDARDAKLYSGGFKKITRDAVDSDLVAVYSKYADGNGADWTTSRRLTEKDWSTVLKSDVPVWIDTRPHQGDVFIRFGVGPKKKPTKVNEQIVDPTEWVGLL